MHSHSPVSGDSLWLSKLNSSKTIRSADGAEASIAAAVALTVDDNIAGRDAVGSTAATVVSEHVDVAAAEVDELDDAIDELEDVDFFCRLVFVLLALARFSALASNTRVCAVSSEVAGEALTFEHSTGELISSFSLSDVDE